MLICFQFSGKDPYKRGRFLVDRGGSLFQIMSCEQNVILAYPKFNYRDSTN